MVLGQLQLEMPKTYFDTWVKNTEFLSFNNELLTLEPSIDMLGSG